LTRSSARVSKNSFFSGYNGSIRASGKEKCRKVLEKKVEEADESWES